MRNTPNLQAERYRITHGVMASDRGYGNNGAFHVPVQSRRLDGHGSIPALVIVSDQAGWDHVSVSLPHRTPTWEEMCQIKDLFFRDDETVIQFHVPKSIHVNCHPYCLHLWRCHDQTVILPPVWMVGAVVGQQPIGRA